MIVEGTVESVSEELAGTELAADATALDESIEVVDLDGLDLDGGTLTIGDEVIAYTIAEDSEGTVDLASPLADSYVTEEPVYAYPESLERLAYVLAPDQDEELEARVPHALYDRLPTGIRDADETAEVVLVSFEDDELVVVDVLSKAPEIDASYIDPGTFTAQPSDGVAPASSPAAVVTGGPGYLVASWDPIANNDPVTYEVYVSASSGFTPTAAEKVGEIVGTSWVITELGDGSPLAYATTYYVKIIARDVDGSAPAGTQDSAQMILIAIEQIDPINFVDLEGEIAAAQILANTITGNHIAANTITAADIAANTITASQIAANTITAAEIATGAITANEIAAGAIDAMTITAAVVRSSSSNPKVQLDSTGLFATDASGNKAVNLTATGGLALAAKTSLTSNPEREFAAVDLGAGNDVIMRLLGYRPGGGGNIVYLSAPPTGTDGDTFDGAAGAFLSLFSDAGGDSAYKSVDADALIPGSGEKQSVRIIDSDGSSSFPVLTADPPTETRMNWGSDSLAVGANNSASETISHGLGRTPTAVLVVPNSAPIVGVTIRAASFTSTQFTVTIAHRDAGSNVGGTVDYSWIALG